MTDSFDGEVTGKVGLDELRQGLRETRGQDAYQAELGPRTNLLHNSVTREMLHSDKPRLDNPISIAHFSRKLMPEVAARCQRYLSPSEVPNFRVGRRHYGPVELYQAFLWGPKGEFTGLPVTPHFEELISEGEAGRIWDTEVELRYYPINLLVTYLDDDGAPISMEEVMGSYRGGYPGSTAFAPPPIRYLRGNNGRPRAVLRFASYYHQAMWTELIRGRIDPYRESFRMPPDLDLETSMTAYLFDLRPDAFAFENWLGALNSGRYPESYGMLHDADGFDAMGVLADSAGAKWKWSKRNDAHYINGGQVWTLMPGEVREMLDCRGDHQAISDFITTLGELGDTLCDHKKVATVLKGAMEGCEAMREGVGKLVEMGRRRADHMAYYGHRERDVIMGGERADFLMPSASLGIRSDWR